MVSGRTIARLSGFLHQVRNHLTTLSNNPRLAGRAVNRAYYRVIGDRITEPGGDVFEADWDTLVVLDACRYDLFEAVADLPGTLERRRSRASNTIGFLRSNLAGRELLDTVYVTANPQFRKHQGDLDTEFHAVVDLWDHGWDEAVNTVRPDMVANAAIEAAEKYPNKRLLIHFNQPHFPFIGSTGRDLFDLDNISERPLPFWQQPMAGELDISDDEIWDAYRENLELTLPHVERLLDELEGKTVITADHGNMIGERAFPVPVKEYGHPNGIHTAELVTVPWLTYSDGARRNVVAEPSSSGTDDDATSGSVEDRLEHLGYK